MHANDPEDDIPEPQEDEPVSKSQRKREMLGLQELGETLVKLPEHRLAKIELPEDLAAAIRFARTCNKHGALRRQLQYIGRLMRDVDPAPIQAQLDAWDGRSRSEKARHHLAERWRDRLVAGDEALDEFARTRPGADLQHLRALARKARAEQAAGRPPRSARLLFREVAAYLDPAGTPEPATDD